MIVKGLRRGTLQQGTENSYPALWSSMLPFQCLLINKSLHSLMVVLIIEREFLLIRKQFTHCSTHCADASLICVKPLLERQ